MVADICLVADVVKERGMVADICLVEDIVKERGDMHIHLMFQVSRGIRIFFF